MFILFFVAFVLAILGVMIRYLKWYWLISGYNTMSAERKRKVDIEELGKFMGNSLFLMAGVLGTGSVLTYFEVPGVSLAVPIVLVALIIYILVKAQQFDSGTRNPDGTVKTSTKIILGSIFAFFAVIGILIFSNTSASGVEVNVESVQIKGLYGVKIMMDNIYEIELVESMPTVLRRTNGFSAGGTLKGHFELKNIGRARLYVNTKKPPFIYIYTVDGLIIINQEDRESTEVLYRALITAFNNQ